MSINQQNARIAQQEHAQVNAALSSIDRNPLPRADTADLPAIAAPTPQEVLEAITKAPGDPAASKAVQALHARAWLADHPALAEAQHIAWLDHWADLKANTLPSIIDSIRAEFGEVGQRLTAAATGPLSGHPSLTGIDLARADTATARAAGPVIADYRHATALHDAWRRITATITSGARPHWSEMTLPTYDQYLAARRTRPQTFPNLDAWDIARKGWPLSLAADFRDATQRRHAHDAQYERDAAEHQRTAARRDLAGR